MEGRPRTAVILSVVVRPAKRDESKRRTFAFPSPAHLRVPRTNRAHDKSGHEQSLECLGAAIARQCTGPWSGALRYAKGPSPQDDKRSAYFFILGSSPGF